MRPPGNAVPGQLELLAEQGQLAALPGCCLPSFLQEPLSLAPHQTARRQCQAQISMSSACLAASELVAEILTLLPN